MKWPKKIGLVLLVIIVGIQFINTRSNQSNDVLSSDFVKTFKVPDDIANILLTSCYNCHSNNTNYPWYSRLQPIGLFLENHINQAKADLNFSEFSSYSVRKQKSKLKSIVSQIEKGEMPMKSYTFIHRDARLSKESKKVFIEYMKLIKDNL